MTDSIQPFQSGDILIPLHDPWIAQTILIVIDERGTLLFLKSCGEELQTLASPPIKADVYIRPRRRSPDFKKIELIESVIAVEIEKAGGKLKLADATSRIAKMRMKIDDCEVQGILRYLVGRGDFVVTIDGKKKPTVRLSLSGVARKREDHRGYAASFAQELLLQSEKIGKLIGHAPTVGGEREELLRDLLERHVPRRFHVATGFIEGSERQVDILIYDQVDFAPVFRAGNLVVVPIEAVRALIEVKSVLTAGQLADALCHLDEAVGIRTSGPPIFRGVFGYRGATVPTLLATIVHHYRELTSEDWDGAPVSSVYDMINAVCVPGSFMLVSKFLRARWRDEDRWSPVFAEQESEAGRDVQAALFYEQLLMFLRHPFEGKHSQPERSASIMKDVESRKITELYPKQDWGAYTIDDGVDRLERQIEAYHEWLFGNPWIEPPPP